MKAHCYSRTECKTNKAVCYTNERIIKGRNVYRTKPDTIKGRYFRLVFDISEYYILGFYKPISHIRFGILKQQSPERMGPCTWSEFILFDCRAAGRIDTRSEKPWALIYQYSPHHHSYSETIHATVTDWMNIFIWNVKETCSHFSFWLNCVYYGIYFLDLIL